MPFGPELSWPNGFRRLDPESRRLDAESRRLLESGYGTGGYRTAPYDHVDPRYGMGAAGHATRPGYQQPAMDDYGYGDPGYSDPSYDGPRNPYTGPMRQLGYSGPRGRAGYQPGFSGPVYPTTGAQEALPATGPQPVIGFPTGPQPVIGFRSGPGPAPADPGSRGYPYDAPRSGADAPRSGAHAADGLRYDDPRLDDPRAARPRLDDPRAGGPRQDDPRAGGPRQDDPRAGGPRQDDPRAGGPRHGGAHATDPRLEGIRYDELRYDEPAYDDEPAYGGSRYDQPLDDVSWYEELRRSAPAYPERPGGQPAGGQRPADPPRHGDARGPAHGQPPGYPSSSGLSGPSGPSGLPGYGQTRDDRGGQGTQMRAGRELSPGPRPGAAPSRPSAPAAPQGLTFQDSSYRDAPTVQVQVGVLTPPSGARVYTTSADTAFTAAPGAAQFLAPVVRPGHGLDGPEITGSWPAQPEADDLEDFEDFWREDDEDEEYRGLFAEDGDEFGDRRTASRQASGRGIGRRRGRSRDHRLWLALLGVVIAAAAAITAIIKFEFPSHGGPVHQMVTPASIGNYQRTMNMEKQTNVGKLRQEVIAISAGQASAVKSAVYASGNSAAGGTEQFFVFIGGHLANAAPATSINDFLQDHPGATVVSAGSLGGKAACVEEGVGTANPVSMCVWFDNDSFGEMLSPTMNAKALATVMLTVRPDLEIVVKN
jgi:hypothetical protein